jgi:hypothetical protein
MSRLLLRRGVLHFAQAFEREGGTAQMAFWKNARRGFQNVWITLKPH